MFPLTLPGELLNLDSDSIIYFLQQGLCFGWRFSKRLATDFSEIKSHTEVLQQIKSRADPLWLFKPFQFSALKEWNWLSCNDGAQRYLWTCWKGLTASLGNPRAPLRAPRGIVWKPAGRKATLGSSPFLWAGAKLIEIWGQENQLGDSCNCSNERECSPELA